MIVISTDFGPCPYTGQMQAVLHRRAPAVPQILLFHDLPPCAPELAAWLLPAYRGEFPAGSVFLCVVDPGVGGPRRPVALQADGHWFVGPDNGLFAIVARRATTRAAWELVRPPADLPAGLSATFHGRDLFAPCAADLAAGPPAGPPPDSRRIDPAGLDRPDWPQELDRIVYVDRFGNLVTGRRANTLPADARLTCAGQTLARKRRFGDVAPGTAMAYANSNGLLEFAVNRGSAAATLGAKPGTPFQVLPAGASATARPQAGQRP